ncbi:MAG: hypothetical protein IKG87_10065 [Clostridia bacterium]|nr:hypothetical protein [Clostridia bacterium]
MKRFWSILAALFILFIALTVSACAETEDPAEPAEEKMFEAEGYTICYEVVPQDRVEEVVGSLAQYAKSDDMDMEKSKLLYIHYTAAKQNDQEMHLGSVIFSLSKKNLLFIVDGIEYTQTSMLINSGTQTYITYLIVPIETTDDAEVSIQYLENVEE